MSHCGQQIQCPNECACGLAVRAELGIDPPRTIQQIGEPR